MKNKGHKIIGIVPGSIGEEMEIEIGDRLVAINDEKIIDVIDYQALCSDELIHLLIEKKDGSIWELDIEKETGEGLGLVFEDDLMDHQKACGNQCVFCFVDQLPKQMRSTLYYKDDDWRLSFIMGNFITLTNLADKEIERIIQRKVSPLYISVHSTEPELRKKIIGNKRAGDILSILKRFRSGGLRFHCQIVLCPGLNDGQHLDKTIQDLWELYPSALSVAVVPVGLSEHREGLYPLRLFTREEAQEVIRQIQIWQERCKKQEGTSFVFPADEFYAIAEIDIPDYESYEDFPQIENGVGILAKFQREFEEGLEELRELGKTEILERKISIATGVSAAPFIRRLSDSLCEAVKGLDIQVFPIENHFFGASVSVSGLVTGGDIIRQLSGKHLGEALLIPRSMLREGENIFLDDVSVDEIQDTLRVNICPVWVDGTDFVFAAADIERE